MPMPKNEIEPPVEEPEKRQESPSLTSQAMKFFNLRIEEHRADESELHLDERVNAMLKTEQELRLREMGERLSELFLYAEKKPDRVNPLESAPAVSYLASQLISSRSVAGHWKENSPDDPETSKYEEQAETVERLFREAGKILFGGEVDVMPEQYLADSPESNKLFLMHISRELKKINGELESTTSKIFADITRGTGLTGGLIEKINIEGLKQTLRDLEYNMNDFGTNMHQRLRKELDNRPDDGYGEPDPLSEDGKEKLEYANILFYRLSLIRDAIKAKLENLEKGGVKEPAGQAVEAAGAQNVEKSPNHNTSQPETAQSAKDSKEAQAKQEREIRNNPLMKEFASPELKTAADIRKAFTLEVEAAFKERLLFYLDDIIEYLKKHPKKGEARGMSSMALVFGLETQFNPEYQRLVFVKTGEVKTGNEIANMSPYIFLRDYLDCDLINDPVRSPVLKKQSNFFGNVYD